ncbi:hypothetical protein NEOKW01_0388 [Nematocida sp. AWRm80]|nr:hypothetical protein NEOKW01_0388 [Nematocida sp. AWRm80]
MIIPARNTIFMIQYLAVILLYFRMPVYVICAGADSPSQAALSDQSTEPPIKRARTKQAIETESTNTDLNTLISNMEKKVTDNENTRSIFDTVARLLKEYTRNQDLLDNPIPEQDSSTVLHTNTDTPVISSPIQRQYEIDILEKKALLKEYQMNKMPLEQAVAHHTRHKNNIAMILNVYSNILKSLDDTSKKTVPAPSLLEPAPLNSSATNPALLDNTAQKPQSIITAPLNTILDINKINELPNRKPSTIYKWTDKQCLFVEAKSIRTLKDEEYPEGYSLCVIYLYKTAMMGTHIKNIKRLDSKSPHCLIWRCKADPRNTDVLRKRCDDQRIANFIPEEPTISDNMQKKLASDSIEFSLFKERYTNHRCIMTRRVSVECLTKLKSVLENKSVFYFHLTNYNNTYSCFLRLIPNHTTIEYLNIILDLENKNTIGYITFSLKRIKPFPSTSTSTPNDQTNKAGVSEEIQDNNDLDHNSEKSISPTVESNTNSILDSNKFINSTLKSIKHLSIINPIAYSVIAVKVTDMVQLVTDQLDISFMIWRMILSGILPDNTNNSSILTETKTTFTISIKKMTIYPIVTDSKIMKLYRAIKAADSLYNLDKTINRQYRNFILKLDQTLFNNDVSNSSINIKTILSCNTIIYSNLTELSFYVYDSEKTNTIAVIDEYYNLYNTEPSIHLPLLKTIILFSIPDTSDHESFNYNYIKMGTIHKTWSFSNTK